MKRSVRSSLVLRTLSVAALALTAYALAANRGSVFPAEQLRFQSSHVAMISYKDAGTSVASKAMISARPSSLASIDLDRDGTPDLVAGYASGSMGLVTIQRGNPDAFAPRDDAVFARMQQGYNPDSLLPTADVYQVPEPVDFLQVGDFNHDNQRDVLIAANGGDLFLLAGDGKGGFEPPRQIALPGVVTALAAGEFRSADGWTDVGVGVSGPSGSQLLIYDGAVGIDSEPMHLALPAPATAIEFGEVDSSPFMGVTVAAGSNLQIVHGWGRKQAPDLMARVESIDLGFNVRSLSIGFFLWSREASKQIAALGDAGNVRILQRGSSSAQPFDDEEIADRARARTQQSRSGNIDIETSLGWQRAQAEHWSIARELTTAVAADATATAQNLMLRSHLSFLGTDDLLVLGAARHRVDVVRQIDTATAASDNKVSTSDDLMSMSLNTSDSPVAALALPQRLNGERDLVVLLAGSAAPTLVPLPAAATIAVDRTDDPAGAALTAASACTGAANDCSLRGAVQFANANPGTTINLPAGTYTLNINGAGGCINEPTATGNTVGDLEINTSTTITGAGAASTIIRQLGVGSGSFPGDRVMCLNVPFTVGLIYNVSGVTITGGRDFGTNIGGGGIIGGEKDNQLNLTGVIISNNQSTGSGAGGGGIQITGGSMTVTNSTIGGTNAPGANRSDASLANSIGVSGGGISYEPGSPTNKQPSTGVFTSSGTTFMGNVANSAAAGGGGLDLYAINLGTGSANIGTTTFSNNHATNQSGGAFILESTLATTVSNSAFNSNSAGNRGGAIYVGGGTLLFDGTAPTITFSGNTAATAGSSVSAAGAVTVSGTNTTIGGSIEVTTNGSWTNNAGSALSPTDVSIIGAPFTCNNSTMNIAGNLSITTGAVVGATFNANSGTVNIAGNLSYTAGGSGPVTTFNAGTGTFNFNGSAAQSISNSASITFNNLTDANTTQPLTLNNSIAVNGSLNVNGANAVLAPVAAAIVSGSGTLTGTGTARVTRTASTPGFVNQYAITGLTLTNLTAEYIGAAAQSVSPLSYGGLKINNASGAGLGGDTTVNGTLTLAAGALGVGTNTLTLNNAAVAGSGTLTSAASGTVIYAQSSSGQNVLTANYGNLTFSNFSKVLPNGTIGVAGTFTPGTGVGHTITGNTFDFNGAGTQAVPSFIYNNLTTSGARGANSVTLANGVISVAGTFNPSATFGGGGYVVTNNTFDFNGAGAQTVPAFNYFNLTISGSRTGASNVTLANAGSIGVAGIFNPVATFGTGTYDVTNSTMNFNGAGAQSVAPFNYNSLTLSGNRGGAAITLGSGTVGIAAVFNPIATNNSYATTGNIVAFNGVAAQTLPAFAFDGLTVANGAGVNLGANISVNSALTLTNGIVGTGANTLSVGANGTRSRSNGYIVGNELKTFGGNSSFTFDVGTPGANNYSPVDATVTAGTGTLTVTANQTAQPNLTVAQQANSLHRYWKLTSGGAGITANLAFSYLDGDVNGTEGNYRIGKVSGGVLTTFANQCPGTPCVDTANNRMSINGVSSFSDWTAGDLNADLTITKTHIGNFNQSDVGKTYTITVTNSGDLPTDGTTLTVTDVVPAGLTPTAAAGTGWACGIVAQTMTCTRADVLAAGASEPAITLTVNVAINATANVINTATVSGGGELVTSNDSASDSTTITDRIFGDGFE
jgi:predicted outer membrane repeat protein